MGPFTQFTNLMNEKGPSNFYIYHLKTILSLFVVKTQM